MENFKDDIIDGFTLIKKKKKNIKLKKNEKKKQNDKINNIEYYKCTYENCMK